MNSLESWGGGAVTDTSSLAPGSSFAPPAGFSSLSDGKLSKGRSPSSKMRFGSIESAFTSSQLRKSSDWVKSRGMQMTVRKGGRWPLENAAFMHPTFLVRVGIAVYT